MAFAYEAGPTGFGLYDDLVANNHTCLVVAPAMVPVAPGQRVKTNRLDSKKLSVSLRGGRAGIADKTLYVGSLFGRQVALTKAIFCWVADVHVEPNLYWLSIRAMTMHDK